MTINLLLSAHTVPARPGAHSQAPLAAMTLSCRRDSRCSNGTMWEAGRLVPAGLGRAALATNAA